MEADRPCDRSLDDIFFEIDFNDRSVLAQLFMDKNNFFGPLDDEISARI